MTNTIRSTSLAIVAALVGCGPKAPTVRAPDTHDTKDITQPGQTRPTVRRTSHAGGAVLGHVIDRSRGVGVAGARLAFRSGKGETIVHSGPGGAFELAPPAAGRFELASISAPGFVPYAPHQAAVELHLERGRAVAGITLFVSPEIEYRGRVVDFEHDKPIAGARVRMLGTLTGEQVNARGLETEWTTDRDGAFTFRTPDGALLEAEAGGVRGWERVDDDVALMARMHDIILISGDPQHELAATLRGRVVDAGGTPLAGVLVHARPTTARRVAGFATTGPDGTFVVEHLDYYPYKLFAQRDGYAPATSDHVDITSTITLQLDPGAVLGGTVVAPDGPVPAFTLLVFRRDRLERELVLARSIIDADGRFEVRVAPGNYELVVAANGFAQHPPVSVIAGEPLRLAVSPGATLRGRIVAADGTVVAGARIVPEVIGAGASVWPSVAGVVSRTDGSFELRGVPSGRVSLVIAARGFHRKIEAGLTARDGMTASPVTVALTRLGAMEEPELELVGIHVTLEPIGDELRTRTVYDGAAAAAGMSAGDWILAIDGVPVSQLGIEGAIGRLRGAEGTTVAITVKHYEQIRELVVTRTKFRWRP